MTKRPASGGNFAVPRRNAPQTWQSVECLRMRNFVMLVASCLLSSGVLFSLASAADPALKTGTAFRQALAAPAGINWSGTPVRAALARLSAAHEVAIIL